MKNALCTFLASATIAVCMSNNLPAQNIDCAKVDMERLMQFTSDIYPAVLPSFFTNLKRMEDAIIKDTYSEKVSLTLLERQISLIAAGRQSAENLKAANIAEQAGAVNFVPDIIAAFDGLHSYAKVLRTLAKEKNEESEKAAVISRRRAWTSVNKVTQTTEEE